MHRLKGAGALSAVAFGISTAWNSGASAHGLDANRVDLRLSGATAYVVATPSVGMFANADTDKNGLLHVDEVRQARQALLAHFDIVFRVANEKGEAGELFFRDVSTPHAFDGTEPQGSGHLRFTLRYRWPVAPQKVRVQWHAAKLQPLEVTALRVKDTKLLPEQEPLGAPEVASLTALRPAEFFLGSTAALAVTATPARPAGAEREQETSGALGVVLRVATALLLVALIVASGYLERRFLRRRAKERVR